MNRAIFQRRFGKCHQSLGGNTALAGNLGGVFKLADTAHEPIQVEQSTLS